MIFFSPHKTPQQRVEYERLKEELRKSLDMLEGREKMLASNEADVIFVVLFRDLLFINVFNIFFVVVS